jgi:hypothetical protein
MTDLADRHDIDAADAALRARVEELQRRRAARSDADRVAGEQTPPAGPARAARRPPGGAARGSKIAAAGLGLTTMLGLVAAMGYSRASSVSTPPVPTAPASPPQVVVVIHPADATPATGVVPGVAEQAATVPLQPIVLNAQPTVRQAPASPAPTQAPAGRTHASR